MKELKTAAYWLVIIGAINWGLVGLLSFNLVSTILGSVPALETLVYILVGVSGVWMLLDNKKGKK